MKLVVIDIEGNKMERDDIAEVIIIKPLTVRYKIRDGGEAAYTTGQVETVDVEEKE